jgi:AraC-like DNA-binding protein
MLGRAGVHPGALRDPENWLPATRILNLLDESAARSRHDDFGILLGECRTFGSLGPVSLLLRHGANLGEVISSMIEYRRLLNDLLHFELHRNGGASVLEWALISGLQSSQGVNLLAAIAYRVLTQGVAIDWQPECIHFRQATPRYLATFERVFRCSLEFGSNLDGMSFSSASLVAPNGFADAELAAHARRLLNLMPGIRADDSMRERTRSVIPFLISNGSSEISDVARCFGLSVRTLQRKLIREGQSFGDLLNEVRHDLAVRYLADAGQSITAVAHLMGYSTASAFSRWFAAEFGMPPGKWRRLMAQRDMVHLPAVSRNGLSSHERRSYSEPRRLPA